MLSLPLLLLLPEGLLGGKPRPHYLLADVESEGHLLDARLSSLDLVDVVQLLPVLYVGALPLGSGHRLLLLGYGVESGPSLLVEAALDIVEPGGDCLQFLIGHLLHFSEDSREVGLEVFL